MSEKINFVFKDTLTDAIEDKIDNVLKSGNARGSLYQLALLQRIEASLNNPVLRLDSLEQKYVDLIEKDSTFGTTIINQLWKDINAKSVDCVPAMTNMYILSNFLVDAIDEAFDKVTKKPVALTSFFQVLSGALGEDIKPYPKYEYDTDTIPLEEFCQKWYQFPVDVLQHDKRHGTHYSPYDVIVVPRERLVDFLSDKAFNEEYPDEVSDEWLRHIHLCADDDTIRQDVEDWIADDRDEAIEEIAEPFDYDWTKFAGTDVLVIQN